MRHTTRLFFPFPDALAHAIANALAPEAAGHAASASPRASEVPKTRGEVRLVPGGLEVHLTADDLPSLRATVNSHLRWVDAATKAARLGGAK